MNNLRSYRQGDIILIEIQDATLLGDPHSNVLAEGEVTGHKHKIINGSVFSHRWGNGVMIVKAEDGTKLTHPEHGHIQIAEGLWEVRIQREYDELNNRNVTD